MKVKNILKGILFFAITFLSVSCEDFLAETNEDPNKSSSVPITALLPQIEIQLADTYGGEMARWNCMYSQQVEGVARQWVAFNQYNALPEDYNSSWEDIYENIIVELKPIAEEAELNGYNHYLGVVKTIEAYTMMIASDVFGDMPYTEAGLAPEITEPVYDDQASIIYPAIETLLNDALDLFQENSGAVAPGSDDVYYGGDVDSWTSAINAILARYYLHLGDYNAALAAAQNSFTESADNMSYQYGAAPNGAPWYRFNDGREGDIEFHPEMLELMEGLNDTDRLAVMNVTFDTSHPYLVAAYRQDLISYREVQFIIAETLFRTNGDAAALRTAYLNGINASFDELGLSSTQADAYIGQASVDPGEGAITLDHIMTQKYIALFAQPEVFSDWRRTGIPSLDPVSGNQIPRRYHYPLNEYLYNSNSPDENTDVIFERVDWDN